MDIYNPKGGRPVKYNDDFYLAIVEEHDDASISQMARRHNVSTSTIVKWIAKGRSILDDKEK